MNHKSSSYGQFEKKPPTYYARVFSWMRKNGVRMGQDQLQFLADFEAKHGKVPPRSINEWKEMGLW